MGKWSRHQTIPMRTKAAGALVAFHAAVSFAIFGMAIFGRPGKACISASWPALAAAGTGSHMPRSGAWRSRRALAQTKLDAGSWART